MRLMSALGGAMVAVLALVVVGCGYGEESQVATTQPAPTTATTIAPQAATTTLPTTATTIAPQAATTTPPTTAPEPTTTTTEAPNVDPATALIGVWALRSAGYMTFQEDETWTWSFFVGGDHEQEGGYTFEDGAMTLATDFADATSACAIGDTGIYEVVFESQDEMAWTEVSDECIARANNIRGFLRYMP